MRLPLPVFLCLAAFSTLLVAGCLGHAPTSIADPEPGPSAQDTIHRADSIPNKDTLRLAQEWAQAASEAAGGQNIVSVSRSESLFVAVGEKGSIVRSSDGIVWSPVNSGTTEDLASVIRAGKKGAEKFFVVGEQGVLLISVDGTHWTSVEEAHHLITGTMGSRDYPSWTGIAWNGSFFLAVGTVGFLTGSGIPESRSTLLTSTDGIHWNFVLKNALIYITSLVWDPALAGGEGRFVATVYRSVQGVVSYPYAYSVDGTSWTSEP